MGAKNFLMVMGMPFWRFCGVGRICGFGRWGFGRGGFFGFAENKFIIKEEVDNHDDDIGEDEDTGAFDEVVVKRETDTGSDMVCKVVDGVKEAKKPSEAGTNEESEGGIPNEKSDDAVFAGISLFPSDARMENVGDNDGESGSDEIGKPEEIAVFDKKTGDKLINEVIKDGDSNAD